jgi:uncharacterized protein YbjT (DUF2867 family)
MARIIVIGGTGLIGSKVVEKLAHHGHDAVAASPRTGVDTLSGQGVAAALRGADTVVDVSNSPSFAPDDVMEFFTTSTRNQLAAEHEAGVSHHVALTIVGTNRPQSIPYFAAKAAQEELIRASGIGFSLVHATQFLDFGGSIADISTDGDTVRLPGALIQPIAAEDVATAVARAAAGDPVGDIEIAGPEAYGMDEFVRRTLAFREDPRTVVRDDTAPYYGAVIEQRTLLPVEGAQIFPTRLEEWLPANPPRR